MKLGHISDLHILSVINTKFYHFFNKRIIGGTNLFLNRRNEYKVEFVEKLIDDVNKQNLDYLVVTGDITNLALYSEFKKAVELLNILNIDKNKIIIIPGNHDNYLKASYKKNVFENYMKPWLGNDINLDSDENWPIFRVLDDILIIGFSSSIPTCPFCAAGEISEYQLKKFDEISQKHKDKFKIVLLHHHLPKLKIRKRYMDGLRNRETVLEYFSKNKVDMVLHGHKHKNSHYVVNFNGYDINVYEAGASARLSLKHTGNWSVYDIQDKKLISIQRRYLDYDSQKFIIKN